MILTNDLVRNSSTLLPAEVQEVLEGLVDRGPTQ